MVLSVVLAFGTHVILFYTFGFTAISITELGLNYLLLLVLFASGQVAIAAERQKGVTAFQKAVKKTMWQRLLLSVLFVLFSSSSAANPIYFSLHFILPYLFLTGVSVYRSKQLL